MLLIEHVVASMATWPVDEVIVVLGSRAEEIAENADLGSATVAIDPEWAEGAAAPLRVGLDMIARRDEGPVVVVDGAYPTIVAEDVAAVIDGHDPEMAPVAISRYRYDVGPPYVIEPELWSHFMGREGDIGLAAVWSTHPEWLTDVRIEKLPPRRIRTASDLEVVQRGR